MKILSRYLVREFLVHLFFSLCVYLFVLLSVKVIKELMDVLISRHIPLGTALGFAAYTLPFMLSFGLPLAVLTATVLTFSKLSADNELIAAQASGVSVWQLTWPVVLTVSVIAVCSMHNNTELAPLGLQSARRLLVSAVSDKLDEDPTMLFEPGKTVTDFPGYELRVEGRDPETRRLKGVWLRIFNKKNATQTNKNNETHSDYFAQEAEIGFVKGENTIHVRLFKIDGRIHEPLRAVNADEWSFDLSLDESTRKLEKSGWLRDRPMSMLLQNVADGGLEGKAALFEINARAAFALACIGFLLVGIPLGMKTHRRESSIGILVSIVVAALYYGLVLLAQSLKYKEGVGPLLLLWTPNVLCNFAGIMLMRRFSVV